MPPPTKNIKFLTTDFAVSCFSEQPRIYVIKNGRGAQEKHTKMLISDIVLMLFIGNWTRKYYQIKLRFIIFDVVGSFSMIEEAYSQHNLRVDVNNA